MDLGLGLGLRKVQSLGFGLSSIVTTTHPAEEWRQDSAPTQACPSSKLKQPRIL